MPPTWKITIPDYSNSHKIFRTTTRLYNNKCVQKEGFWCKISMKTKLIH